MLEACSVIHSTSPEQHIEPHLNGRVKVLGYCSHIGKISLRQTPQAFVQDKRTDAMTLLEGCYNDGWFVITTRADLSAPILLNDKLLTTAKTLTMLVPGDQLRYISHAGSQVYSIAVHRSLFSSDPRCALLDLNFPEKNCTLEVSDKLRLSVIERIKMLLSYEMNTEEFHMEVVDLVATLLSTTFLQPEYSENSSRIRIVQRATEAILKRDPRSLNPAWIAELAFTSIRTLEYSFREVLGMTPKQYIDFYRINLLREKIIDAPHIPIMHHGYEVGLSHLGNLSKNYKALYGETPSATKRKLAER